MKRDLLCLLRCPDCGSALHVTAGELSNGELEQGTIACHTGRHEFPVQRFVPRFAPHENYSSTFGFQWLRFRQTQLDSHTGLPISRDRFFTQSAWNPADLRGALVLDAGCGAGRFAQVALDAGATVVAIDYSTAVDACRSNLGSHPRLHLAQADIYRLPFAPGTFDFVYSFGVLQHTPDVERAFTSLVAQVKPGGRLAIDLYPATPLNYLWPKYWLRPFTRRLGQEHLYRLVQRMVAVLLPISLVVGRIPRAGRRIRHIIPVANYEGILPLSPEQIREWAVLDTYDMLAPAHDHPQSVETVRRWFDGAGLLEIDVGRRGLVVGRGRKSAAAPLVSRESAGHASHHAAPSSR